MGEITRKAGWRHYPVLHYEPLERGMGGKTRKVKVADETQTSAILFIKPINGRDSLIGELPPSDVRHLADRKWPYPSLANHGLVGV